VAHLLFPLLALCFTPRGGKRKQCKCGSTDLLRCMTATPVLDDFCARLTSLSTWSADANAMWVVVGYWHLLPFLSIANYISISIADDKVRSHS